MNDNKIKETLHLISNLKRLWSFAKYNISILENIDNDNMQIMSLIGIDTNIVVALQNKLATFKPLLDELERDANIMSILAPKTQQIDEIQE